VSFCHSVADEDETRTTPTWQVQFHLQRPRTGGRIRSARELVELTARAAHEQEMFAPEDWEFIQWLAGSTAKAPRPGLNDPKIGSNWRRQPFCFPAWNCWIGWRAGAKGNGWN
jgi:hypothetical protein